jgi:hypothetical protein
MACIIEIIFVGSIIALSFVSFAWFTANKVVETNSVNITAAETSNVSIVTISNEEYTPYKGETGLGYEDDSLPDLAVDIAYTATKTFSIVCSPLQDNYAFYVNLSDAYIELSDGTFVDQTTDSEILNSFTWRFHLYDSDSGVITSTYDPGEDGFITLSSGDITTNGSYLYIPEDITLECDIELIFLDEESYSDWEDKIYENLVEFRYDDYDYMRATFNFIFDVGMDIAPTEG